MTLLERVQTLIKEKGLTVKQVERDCGLANATIRRWQSQNPSLESVAKVANHLQVSLDYLAGGDSPFANLAVIDGIEVSESESDLIAMYRYLDANGKENLFDFATMLYEKATGERGSIYSTYSDTRKQQEDDPVSGIKPILGIV